MTVSGRMPRRRSRPLDDGEVLLLENLRFHKGEEKNEPEFVAALAKLGDIYVDDAFSASHRAHASIAGIAEKLPAYAGRGMEAELTALDKALGNPTHPVAAIVGGAKISDQARPAVQPGGQGRSADPGRRHGQHLPAGARRCGRQVAGRSRHAGKGARDRGHREIQRLHHRAACRCAGRREVRRRPNRRDSRGRCRSRPSG